MYFLRARSLRRAGVIAVQFVDDLNHIVLRHNDRIFLQVRQEALDSGSAQHYDVGHHPVGADAAVDAKD